MVNADDNLVPGGTYTFSFKLNNWITMPSISTILGDLNQNAPSFLSSVNAQWAAGLSPLTNYLNVTFTYTGDGSDVASDVWTSMLDAFSKSGDSFDFVQGTMGTVGASISADLSQTTTEIGQAAGNVVAGAVGGVSTGLGTTGTIIVVLVLAAVVLFELGGIRGTA